jgi:hypothetical protein
MVSHMSDDDNNYTNDFDDNTQDKPLDKTAILAAARTTPERLTMRNNNTPTPPPMMNTSARFGVRRKRSSPNLSAR